MKKILKKIPLCLIAFTMIFCMLFNVLAVENKGSLTVNVKAEPQQTLQGKTIYIFKLFDVTKTDTVLDYKVNEIYREKLKEVLSTEFDTDTVIYNAIANLQTNEIQKFANDFNKKVIANGTITGTASKDYYKSEAITNSVTTYQFNNIPYGYYLVYSPDLDTLQSSLVTVSTTNASVNLKSDMIKVEKSADKENAQIGEVVKFTVNTKIPDISMFAQNDYKFTLKDTLSTGLTFVNDADGTALTNNQLNVTVTVAGGTGTNKTTTVTGQIMELDLADVIKNNQASNIGKTLTIEYYAQLNSAADLDTQNKAEIEYSNNPSNTSTGATVPSIVNVPTFPLQIKKYSATVDYLDGAKFKLYKSDAEGNKTETEIKVSGAPGNYTVLENQNVEVSSSEMITMGQIEGNGYNLKLNGLAAGVYWLTETEAPEDYNKLSKPIKIEIKKSTNDHGYEILVDEASETDFIIEIENKSGTELPSTGGIGTIIFTVGGVVIIGAMIVVSVISKKKNKL